MHQPSDAMRPLSMRAKMRAFVEAPGTQNFVLWVILLNAVGLGLETSPTIMRHVGGFVEIIDTLCLGFFLAEISVKLYAYGWRFFRSGWNIFDAVIVGIALVPGVGALSAMRAIRVMRILRVVSISPTLRRVVMGLLAALPGMGSVFLLLAVIYYISSVMATQLFGLRFDEWFGTVGRSAYTLFQIMTLEGWSDAIVRPVMEVYPYAWAFFVPFILVTAFAVVNLLVGLVVSSLQEAAMQEGEAKEDDYRDEVLRRLEAIERRMGER